MSLSYILRRISSEEGYGNLSSNAEQKQRLIDYINRASQYLYDALEMQGTDMELSTYVTMGAELITPAYINRLISVRFHHTQEPWDVTDLRPRYSNTPWKEKWNHFREKRPTTLAVRLSAPTQLVFTGAADGTVLNITGQTASARQTNESLSMNGTGTVSKTTTNSFISNPFSITKSGRSQQDITITDTLGNTLGSIYNNLPRAFYRVFDVSVYPNVSWNAYQYPVDILYQEGCPRLEEPADEFPMVGWDDFIVTKTRQLLLLDKPETFDSAVKMEVELVAQINAWKTKQNEGRKQVIQVQENPLLVMDKHFNFPEYDKRSGSWFPQHAYYP